MFEGKVKFWLKQKSLELFTEANDTFVGVVLNLLDRRQDEREFFDKLERVLEDDTKPFVKGLWRYLVFEQLKLKQPFRGAGLVK